MEVNKSLSQRKAEILNYFRERANESREEIRRLYGDTNKEKQASLMNNAVVNTKNLLIATLEQKAKDEEWSNEEILDCILMVTYASYIVMLEFRNAIWPYEYMAFSRRIGELWEPFCRLCFEYPLTRIRLFVPPLFSEVKSKFKNEIEDFIDKLNITSEQKKQLKRYYDKAWGLVTSGEIKLELDLHFETEDERIVVDFKSGFGSNEKGNMNRLLLVGSIYKNLEENYRCMLLVRSIEDRNNNYFQTLKNSGIWDAYCGDEAYKKIQKYSGFDLRRWIEANVDWDHDFKTETMRFFRENDLVQYLTW